MLAIYLVMLLQTPNTTAKQASPIGTPRTTSVIQQSITPQNVSPIKGGTTITTPQLSIASQIQAAHELGSQEAQVGQLKEKITTLEKDREDFDRPDINGLKTDHKYVEWTFAILGTILGTLFTALLMLRGFLRRALRPELRRFILNIIGPAMDDRLQS
jgi:hypothetical protein